MENHEDNLQQEIIDSLAKKVTNLEKRQDEMDKNDLTSIPEKIKQLEIKVSGISETHTLENTKQLERFDKQLNEFDEKINAIPTEIPINHKLQFDTKSKFVIRVILVLGLGVAILLAISISLFIENGRKADETNKFLILKGFYPDIAIAIDSAYIVNPDTLIKKAQINIDKQQAMSEAALEAKRAAEQSKQANDKLKKLKSKRPVTRKRDQ